MGQSGTKQAEGRIGFHTEFCRTAEGGRPVALSLDEGLMKGEGGLNCALREGGGGDPQPLRKKRAGGPGLSRSISFYASSATLAGVDPSPPLIRFAYH